VEVIGGSVWVPSSMLQAFLLTPARIEESIQCEHEFKDVVFAGSIRDAVSSMQRFIEENDINPEFYCLEVIYTQALFRFHRIRSK